ncbi:MAG TPA: DUF5681 domain-containing protein [Candidatus Acidoferrum sp.]
MTNKTQKARQVDAESKVNNPPEETGWKKGCPSPNPAGRPRTGVFSEAAKAILAEEDPKLRKTGAERLIEQAFRRALQGSYRHLELLLAYAEGRPKKGLDLAGKDGNPLETQVKIIHIGAKDVQDSSNRRAE